MLHHVLILWLGFGMLDGEWDRRKMKGKQWKHTLQLLSQYIIQPKSKKATNAGTRQGQQ